MGWTGHKLPKKGWNIFTRGGCEGVFIQKDGSDEEIPIPRKILFMLVADEIRNERIAFYENSTDEEVLNDSPHV